MLSAEMGEGLLLRWTVAESRDTQASSVVAHVEVGLLNIRDFILKLVRKNKLLWI